VNVHAFNEGKASQMTMLNDHRARFLMCRPEHFAVSYTINPWMNPKRWARDAGAHAAAEREWAALHRKLVELGAAGEVARAGAGAARSRLHGERGRRARSPGAVGALPASAAPARGRAFRSSLSVAAGARPHRWRDKAARGPRARRRRRLRLGRAAQSVLDGL